MKNEKIKGIDFIFNPRSIALVGIPITNPEHWTRTFFNALIAFEYEYPVYLVNRKGGEIKGNKVYRSLDEIDGPIDYVISTVGASGAPGLVKECAQKGVKAIHFCTAGFSETGETEGIKLETEVAELGRKYGVRILGPNCMGIYYPEGRLSFRADFPKDSGPIGIVSQSGLNSSMLIRDLMWRGARFSRVISYGNACDLNETDSIEYLADDPKTKIIALYIEGVSDPARFKSVLKRAAQEKIVVLLKGGTTKGGKRAAAGHTGALAGNEVAWKALCRQLGIIQVSTLEEMSDMLVTLIYMEPPGGDSACLIGAGGGSSVLVADEFERNGFTVRPLPDDVKSKIRRFTPIAGNILANPIDYGQTVWEIPKLIKTVDIIMESEDIDFIVLFLSVHNHLPNEPVYQLVNHVLGQNKVPEKPIALVLKPSVIPEEAAAAFDLINKLSNLKLPIFYSYSRAAKAICSLIDYEELWPGKTSKLKYLSRVTMRK